MNLYKGVEYIKNIFSQNVSCPGKDSVRDAETLSFIGADARFLRARNGCVYFYYCPLNVADLEVAKFLLARNGIRASVHNSRFYYRVRPILRAPRRRIAGNPERMNFVKSIDVTNNKSVPDFESRMREIQNQMQQRTK